MKPISEMSLYNAHGGNFMDGYCGGAAAVTIVRAVATASIKAAFGGPVGWFLAASDVACAGYTIYGMVNNW